MNYLEKFLLYIPLITGEDLKKLGIKPGPFYTEILKAILKEKLEERLLSKDDEIKFVEKFKGVYDNINYE